MGLNVHVDLLVYAVTQTTHKHFNYLLIGNPTLHRVECASSCISIFRFRNDKTKGICIPNNICEDISRYWFAVSTESWLLKDFKGHWI